MQQADADEWMSLQEASDLLGVATSTLRRWGDDGRVQMKRTLGGHRRFLRATILHLVDHAGSVRAMTVAQPQQPWGVDEREMAQQDWHARLATRGHPDTMRGLGQRLLGLLIQYINRREEDGRFLSEARQIGVNYGREAHEASITMHDTVEAFLFFRRSFAQLALPIPGIAQPTDLEAAAALHGRIDRFMDAILLGVIDGFENRG